MKAEKYEEFLEVGETYKAVFGPIPGFKQFVHCFEFTAERILNSATVVLHRWALSFNSNIHR